MHETKRPKKQRITVGYPDLNGGSATSTASLPGRIGKEALEGYRR
jgi:hypothetical protein